MLITKQFVGTTCLDLSVWLQAPGIQLDKVTSYVLGDKDREFDGHPLLEFEVQMDCLMRPDQLSRMHICAVATYSVASSCIGSPHAACIMLFIRMLTVAVLIHRELCRAAWATNAASLPSSHVVLMDLVVDGLTSSMDRPMRLCCLNTNKVLRSFVRSTITNSESLTRSGPCLCLIERHAQSATVNRHVYTAGDSVKSKTFR